MNVVIIGCGDIGLRCARLLTDAGHHVLGVKRNPSTLPGWLPSLQADVLDPASLEPLRLQAGMPVDVVLYILAAASFTEQAYHDAYVRGLNNTLQALQGQPLKRFIYVSSTGVYHQNDGSEVNEESATEPTRFNGRIVLEGESLVRSLDVGSCVRFSGIYGPDRLRLINRVAAGQATTDTDSPLTNRIHIEDCAGVLTHLVSLVDAGVQLEDVYLASDCEPATSRDVESFIAQTLGLSVQSGEPVARPRRIAGSKRCVNKRLLDSGYAFKYPDYKAGYAQVIETVRSS